MVVLPVEDTMTWLPNGLPVYLKSGMKHTRLTLFISKVSDERANFLPRAVPEPLSTP